MNNRRKFRSQTSDNKKRWKSKGGKSQGGEVKKWEDQRRARVGSKKMQVREKVGQSRFTVFFPMIWGSGGWKSNLAKAAGAEPAGQMRDEKLHAVVVRSTFPSQKCQKPAVSDHFWKLRCRKSARLCGAKHMSKSKCTKHTVFGPLLEVKMSKKCTPLWREARFQVKSVKKPTVSDHFWKLRYRKSARRCGAKHISKSKCTKHTMFGPLLEVEMSKKCASLWREAHFEVKMHKTHQVWTTFGSWDVEKVHAVVARSTFPSQECQKT